MIYVGFIILITLITLCVILGGIYAYIYYTKINPRRPSSRKYPTTQAPPTSETPTQIPSKGIHMFLFRKNWLWFDSREKSLSKISVWRSHNSCAFIDGHKINICDSHTTLVHSAIGTNSMWRLGHVHATWVYLQRLRVGDKLYTSSGARVQKSQLLAVEDAWKCFIHVGAKNLHFFVKIRNNSSLSNACLFDYMGDVTHTVAWFTTPELGEQETDTKPIQMDRCRAISSPIYSSQI